MKNQYLVCFDVGGTKIDAVLFDCSGKIISHITDRGGVPVDIGIKNASEHYKNVIKKLIETARNSLPPECCDMKISSLYGSVATADYFGTALGDYMKAELPFIESIRIEEDGPCLISGMLGHRDGCSIICGTGSSLYIRTGDRYHHIGGGGYLLDSCGSGYILGREALKAAFRAREGRIENTILCDLIEKQCGQTLPEHYTEIYSRGRAHIASFANTVFEARSLCDRVAVRIFNSCAAELAELVFAAYREIGKPFDLVYNGGIFYNYREYAEAVRALSPSCVRAIFSDVKPIYGCAVEAMYSIGLSPDEGFKKTFTTGL